MTSLADNCFVAIDRKFLKSRTPVLARTVSDMFEHSGSSLHILSLRLYASVFVVLHLYKFQTLISILHHMTGRRRRSVTDDIGSLPHWKIMKGSERHRRYVKNNPDTQKPNSYGHQGT